jgi:hypothetical protein
VGGFAGDLEHQQEVHVEGAARLLEVHVEKAPVVRLAGCHHHVVDRGRQVTEESREWSRIGGIEGRYAQRFKLAGGELKAFGIPACEDQPDPLSVCSSGRFEPNAGAAADYNDSLPEELRFAPDGDGGCCGAHASSRNSRSRASTSRRERCRSRRSRSLRQLFAGLFRHHVRGIPVCPVHIVLSCALLVLAVGSLRTPKRARQIVRRCEGRRRRVNATGKPRRDFLEQPAVAVRIAERGE